MGVGNFSKESQPGFVRHNEVFVINDKEIERLHLRHHLSREVFQGNFSSPVHEVLKKGWAKILDVDSGPGTWLFNLSATYPGCTYIGTNPTCMFSQITNGGKPFDVEFIEADLIKHDPKRCPNRECVGEELEIGLPFADNSFDFVSMRHSLLNYTQSEWKDKVIKELIRVLKPGGWLEISEFGLIRNFIGTAFKKYNPNNDLDSIPFLVANSKFINQIPEIIETSGEMHNTNHEIKNLPVGSYGGKLGEISSNFCLETYKILLPKISNYLGIRSREIDSVINKVVKEMNESESYIPVHRIYGQKKEEQNSFDI